MKQNSNIPPGFYIAKQEAWEKPLEAGKEYGMEVAVKWQWFLGNDLASRRD
jgi:hypothetical protein